MPKGIKKVTTPVVVTPPTKEEKIQSFLYHVKWELASAEETKDKLAKGFQGSFYDATYTIQWMSGCYEKLTKGWYYKELLDEVATGKPIEEVLKGFISSLQGQIKCWRPQNSTSPYSNAAEGEKFNALREILERVEGGLAYITKEEGILV